MAHKQFKGWDGSTAKPIPQTITVGAWQTDVPGRIDAFVIWDSGYQLHHVVGIKWTQDSDPMVIFHEVRAGSALYGRRVLELEQTPFQPNLIQYLLDCFREVAAELASAP